MASRRPLHQVRRLTKLIELHWQAMPRALGYDTGGPHRDDHGLLRSFMAVGPLSAESLRTSGTAY
jgi:hypothetical protein